MCNFPWHSGSCYLTGSIPPPEILGICDTFDTVICIAHKWLKDIAMRCVLRAVNASKYVARDLSRTPLVELTALPQIPTWIHCRQIVWKEKWILLLFRQLVVTRRQPSVTEQQTAQITHEWDAAVSRGVSQNGLRELWSLVIRYFYWYCVDFLIINLHLTVILKK